MATMRNNTKFQILLVWTVLIFTAGSSTIDGSEKNVEVIGVVGGAAELPCDVDVSDCGRVYFITWTKNVSGEWKRLYLYSDAVEKPLQELANPSRADFKLEDSTAYLRIYPIRIEDDGVYKCDVTYVQGKCPSLSFATLVTHATPGHPQIERDGKASPNGSTVGPFYEGAALNLECETHGGKPTPEVSWYKGSTELNSESEVRVEKSGASSVVSTVKVALQREDLGARVECRVDNEATDEPLVSWVEVDLHVGPLSLELEGPSVPVSAGNTVMLICTIEGAKPAANATWFNRSDVLEATPRVSHDLASDGTFTTISEVSLKVSRYDHQVQFFCKGTNSVVEIKKEPGLLKSVELQVLFPPAITMQPAEVLLNQTQTAVVYCTYEANPFNVTDIVWYHQGRALPVPTPGKYEMNTQGYPGLSIKDLEVSDAGGYSCALSNVIGRGNASNLAVVNVMFPPVMEAFLIPARVREGGTLAMQCNLREGNPQNVFRTRWFRDGQSAHESTQREVHWEGVTRDASGLYACEGENAAGWGNRSEEVLLEVMYLPGPADLMIVYPPALKGETAELTCVVEQPGLPIADVFRWEKDGELLATTSGPNYTTDALRVSSRGNYSCAAVNEVGVGPKGYESVDVLAPPTFITGLPEIKGAARDAPFISFECRVECQPLCQIFWRKGGTRVNSSPLFSIRSRVVPEDVVNNLFTSAWSSLQLNMTAWPGRRLERERDKANYTCFTAPNEVGDGVESTMQFVVEYPPEQLSLTESIVRVGEGDIPEPVGCHASAFPPATFLWRRADRVMARDHTLTFNDSATRRYAGAYVCVAENQHGRAQIEMQLQVLYKPECVLTEDTNDEGSQVLVCRADGFPTKINFTWSKDNETIDLDDYDDDDDDDDDEDDDLTSVYVLTGPVAERFGMYQCIAINDVGDSEPCQRMVTGPGLAGWHAEFGDKNVLVIAAIIGSVAILFVLAIIIIIVIMRRRRSRDFGSPGKAPLGGGDGLYQNVSGPPSDPKHNGPSAPDAEGNTMYENMPFHRTGPYKPDSTDEMVYADLYDDVKSGKVPDPRMKPPLPPKGIGKAPKEPPLPPKTKKGGFFDALGI